MENWLVRTTMNVQRHSTVDRREWVQSNGLLRRSSRVVRQTLRGYTGGGRLTGGRRARNFALSDEDTPVANSFHGDVKEIAYVRQQCCDGYLTSAQLLVYPGSLNAETEECNLKMWGSLVSAVQLIHEDLACPICLYPPVFPRMERCGHVYCGPCLIQYVRHENESTAKKCAVCSWVIRLSDLKRVKLIRVLPVSIGCSVDLVLLKRCVTDKRSSNLYPVGCTPTGLQFKSYEFIKETTSEEILSQVAEEVEALKAYKAACIEEGDVEIIPFIGALISDVELEMKDAVLHTSLLCDSLDVSKLDTANEVGCGSEDTFPVEKSVYFYQACDGQPIFLDGLMWKCLSAEYKDAVNFPKTLSVTVTGVKTYKMNPVLRKRWRYLSHVPSGRIFSMVEINLEPLVSRSTLEQFSSALNARLAEQNRRQLEDLRLTQLKEAAENRLPTLPEGFKLSGHAELCDQRLPDLSEFVPLGTIVPVQCTSTTSFAEVTRMGAKSVVDAKRIATFARKSANQQQPAAFNLSAEFWPSLVASSRDNKVGSDSWRCSFVGKVDRSLAAVDTTDQSSIKQPSKKRKKKRPQLVDNS